MCRLQVTDLSATYETQSPMGQGLNASFSLQVPRFTLSGGQFIGIAGRSGEGKSTLLHTLGLLLEQGPNVTLRGQYEYTFEGEERVYKLGETTGISAEQVRNEAFGFIFQRSYLLPHLSVLDNEALPFLLRPGLPLNSIRPDQQRLLEDLKLEKTLWNRRPGALSGGQAQRVACARALIHDPPFLLADEPTASLDVERREDVLQMLRAHADRGNCVILVSHELSDLARYCDRILVVKKGRLVYPFFDDDAPRHETGFDSAMNHEPSDQLSPQVLPSVSPQTRRRSRKEEEAACLQLNRFMRDEKRSTDSPAFAASTSDRRAIDQIDAYQPDSDGMQDHGFTSGKASSVSTFKAGPPALGLRVFGFAWRELTDRKQALIRLGAMLFILLGTAQFRFCGDLGKGIVNHIQRTTLTSGEKMRTVVVRDKAGELNNEQKKYLDGFIPKLKTPPTYQKHLLSLQIFNANDKAEHTGRVCSVPVGDAILEPVSPAEFSEAQMGVRYVSGGPFGPDDNDKAGIIVSQEFLRDVCQFKALNGNDVRTIPSELTLQLAAERDSRSPAWEEAGFDGKVTVPIIGIFEYPRLIKEQYGHRLAEVYLPEGFMTRVINDWKAAYAFRYCRARSNRPIVPDYSLITEIQLKTNGTRTSTTEPPKADWSTDADLRADVREIFRVAPQFRAEQNALVVQLSPKQEVGHRISRATFERKFEAKLKAQVKLLSKMEAVVDYRFVPVIELFPDVPKSLDQLELRHDLANLRFARLEDVLPTVSRIRRERPDLDVRIDDPVSISQILSTRSVVAYGTLLLDILFVAGLSFVIGLTAYLHIISKSGDIGILRSFGLTRWKIASLYQVELCFMTIPAAVMGIWLAWGAARLVNDPLATALVSKPISASFTAPELTTADSTAAPAPAIFSSMQDSYLHLATDFGRVMLLVLGVLVVGNIVGGVLVWNNSIVSNLRNGCA